MNHGAKAAVFLTTAILLVAVPGAASAHCDGVDGPVVADARAALQAGRVDRVLKWISAEQEAEVQAAFAVTLKVRGLGDQARELADRYFFETLVRLHRASEGAPYTGLKPAGSPVEPGVVAADRALRTGSSERVAGEVAKAVRQGIERRFDRVIRLRRVAERSPADGRRYVAAYVDYVHYVSGLHAAASGPNHQH